MVTGVVGFAVVEGFFVVGGALVAGALVVTTVVCRSVGLTGVVSSSPLGFSVLWPPGRINRNSLM